MNPAPSTSFCSTFLSQEDADHNDPEEFVFVPKDVPSQLYIKKESDKRRLWSGKTNINKTTYIAVLNKCHQTVAYIRRDKRIKRLLLLDATNHEAFVLCLPYDNAFAIYSRRPRTAAYNMLATVQYAGDPFFPWVKVSHLRNTPIFQIWTGQSFGGRSNDRDVIILKAVQQYSDKNNAAFLEIFSEDNLLLSTASNGTDSKKCKFQLAADADPAMMLTLLAALAPEMIGD
jgi:hypothetical protein